jgi:hypothetical protein
VSATRRLLAFGAVVAAAACVDIATGPQGVASVRLLAVPPSIVIGDTLRDSTGNIVTLRAVAFGENGDTIKDAEFRFTGLALPKDTTAAQRVVPVVVDSLTGAVRAITPTVANRARLAVRLGDRLQVLDTITLVKPPTRLARETAGDTLRVAFLCSDTGRAASAVISTLLNKTATTRDTVQLGNAFPLSVTLTADSTGTLRAAVPSYYVRFEVTSPADIPTVTRGGVRRPAIGIVADPLTDRTTNTDTTESAGTATAYLRVLPEGLPPTGAFADSVITVTVRATARRSPTVTVPDTVRFVVRLRRLTLGLPSDTTVTPFPREPLTGTGCGR